MANADPPVLVVAAALVDEAGRVLVQQRPSGGSLARLWEFPGGKVEPGESPPAALARELHEELGIVVAEDVLSPVTFACTPPGERPLVLLLFDCREWEGGPEPLVAVALRWCDPAALAGMPMPPLDRPLVAALIARSVPPAPEG